MSTLCPLKPVFIFFFFHFLNKGSTRQELLLLMAFQCLQENLVLGFFSIWPNFKLLFKSLPYIYFLWVNLCENFLSLNEKLVAFPTYCPLVSLLISIENQELPVSCYLF